MHSPLHSLELFVLTPVKKESEMFAITHLAQISPYTFAMVMCPSLPQMQLFWYLEYFTP